MEVCQSFRFAWLGPVQRINLLTVQLRRSAPPYSRLPLSILQRLSWQKAGKTGQHSGTVCDAAERLHPVFLRDAAALLLLRGVFGVYIDVLMVALHEVIAGDVEVALIAAAEGQQHQWFINRTLGQ